MTGCKRLHIDLETYGEVDLTDCGVYAYAEHPSFEILLIGYAYGDNEVQVLDLAQGETIPEELIQDIVNPEVAKVAHNASFERICLSVYLRKQGRLNTRYMKATNWHCTSVRAAELGMPRSLAEVGKALHLEEDKAKLSIGKQLIAYFCKPCKPTKTNGGRTRNFYYNDIERWDLFKEYNKRDVIAEREIDKLELQYESTRETEEELYTLDQEINDAGVAVDMVLIDRILGYVNDYTLGLLDRAKELTGIENPNSLIQVKNWLMKKGLIVDSLDKEALGELLKTVTNPEVKEYLQIRQELGKTSVAKFDAMKRAAIYHEEDDTWRVHGMLMFYGAMRTGRWAGRIVQLQNLPRNSYEDLGLIRQWVRDGEWETLELCFPNMMDLFSQLIRTAFIPAKGNRFVVADYNAIEARVIAWMAGEEWKLDIFRKGGKLYESTASRMFKVPIEQIKHDSPLRAQGKVAELAGGYGGGVSAFRAMDRNNVLGTDDEVRKIINDWRNANSKICELWTIAENAMKEAIRNPGQITKVGKGLAFRMQRETLFMRLPCKRALAYREAKIERGAKKDEITYLGENSATGHYEPIRSYGGRIVENIVQATARDCLAFAMKALSNKGYKIRFHVHDEVIVEVPEDTVEEAKKDITSTMAIQLPWNEGMPLRAEEYDCSFYLKQ